MCRSFSCLLIHWSNFDVLTSIGSVKRQVRPICFWTMISKLEDSWFDHRSWDRDWLDSAELWGIQALYALSASDLHMLFWSRLRASTATSCNGRRYGKQAASNANTTGCIQLEPQLLLDPSYNRLADSSWRYFGCLSPDQETHPVTSLTRWATCLWHLVSCRMRRQQDCLQGTFQSFLTLF